MNHSFSYLKKKRKYYHGKCQKTFFAGEELLKIVGVEVSTHFKTLDKLCGYYLNSVKKQRQVKNLDTNRVTRLFQAKQAFLFAGNLPVLGRNWVIFAGNFAICATNLPF